MTELKPTDEQQAVIDLGVAGESFVVDAVAGSGKTTVLNMASRAMGNRILYLVYNKAAANDAKKAFPKNVEVKTTAALAFREYRELYGDRILGPRVPAWQTAKLLKINRPLELGQSLLIPPQFMARYATEAVDKFCFTPDKELTEKHVPELPAGLELAQEALLKQEITFWAAKLWKQSLAPASQLRFTFDAAFKLYVLSDPTLDYDCIMLDEAQDSNGIVEHFIKNQYAQKVIVGDPAQQLYGWRGATNIMGKFEGERLPLSQSWRFGERIAEEADKWLAHTGTGITVRGNAAMDSVVTDGKMAAPNAILCRTNASAMVNAMEAIENGQRVALVGGTKSLEALAFAAGALKKGEATTHPELIAFRSWTELVDYTEEPGGGDLKALVSLIQVHGIPAIIDACKNTVDEIKGEPDLVVSTAHKSKGREWLNVQIGPDFKEPKPVVDPLSGETGPGPILKADAMLHYVAVTRARQHLDRGALGWVDSYIPLQRNGSNWMKIH